YFGGSMEVALRQGHFQARGPFLHAILAGTIGAACLPAGLYFWKEKRALSLTGIIAMTTIIVASGSRGSVMTAFMIVVALHVWRVQRHLRLICWGTVLNVVLLDFVMTAPVYFLLARI